MSEVSRRMFLRAGALAGGGALFSFGWIADALAAQTVPGAPASAGFRPNGFVRIDADGTITIWSKNPDMGQGVKTALPMILADEMDADWAQVKTIDAELDRAKFGGQGSGGSDSIRSEWDLYRNAGAAAREMLASAAAEQWGVPRDACRTEKSAVIHSESNRRLSYGRLAASAATRPVPDKPAWKPVSAFTLMGTRVGGVDNDAIVSGRPLYGIDTRLRGNAVRRHCQVPGVRRPAGPCRRSRRPSGAWRAGCGPDRRPCQPDVPAARCGGRRRVDVGGLQGPRCAHGRVGRGPLSRREQRLAVPRSSRSWPPATAPV